jgi:hypothetical protein
MGETEMNEQIVIMLLKWVVAPFGYLIVILLGVQILAPRGWLVIEQVWWRQVLGNSAASQLLRREMLNDFKRSVERWANDNLTAPPLAVLLAILARPFELKRLTGDLKCAKSEMLAEIFESAIEQLNAGWREGKDPEILMGYMKTIEDSLDDPSLDAVTRLRGRSAVAVVRYALGELQEGNRLGAQSWADAWRLEPEEESALKFIASYSYFNSTLFLGEFKNAMNLMADQWSRYYAPLGDSARERLRGRLSGYLILNPVLAIPRHIILAAAFNERPRFERKFWPSEAVYQQLAPEERECKLRWVEAWYEEAQRVCLSEPTSLSFSHAYAAFYFTLLLLEQEMPAAYLHDRINQAFDAIDDSSAFVAQYTKFGFRGVYHLTCGEDEKALESLGQAARLSAISGNRFADSVFMCSHAVAAARLNRPSRYLAPDINHYLSKADRLAQTINRPFYKKLYYGAQSAVCLLRGETAAARRYAAWSKRGTAGDRILKIFYRDGQEP